MPALPTTGWTVDMLEALPDDGKRYEIIDGELFVTSVPSLAHQRAIGELAMLIDSYLRPQRDVEVLFSPSDIRAGEPTSVQPDLFVMPRGPGKGPGGWPDLRELRVAVEVLEPDTARVDRGRKRALYQREGVPEYWIVDLDSRLVERWRPGDERPEILRETIEWRVEGAAEPLVIDLVALFGEAFGE